MSADVVVIDNYDSFTYNLVDYLGEHVETMVVPNDVDIAQIVDLDPDGIVISPGPGHPANTRDVGVVPELLLRMSQTVPTFGVCLGLEIVVHTFGGRIGPAPRPVHGEATTIAHDGQGVYRDLPETFSAGRYHSLIPLELSDDLIATAWSDTDDGRLIMGVRHRELPIECVLFHPESVLTPIGRALMANVASMFEPTKPQAEVRP